MTVPSAYRVRRGIGIFPILNRFVVLLIFAVAIAAFAVLLIPEMQQHKKKRMQLKALQLRMDSENSTLDRRKQELRLLQTDPEYLEIIARDKMDYMKEGETIFRINGNKAMPVAPEITAFPSQSRLN